MIRMFVGMIVGAISAIVAADGAVTADRIIMNAGRVAEQSVSRPDMLFMILGVWGIVAMVRFLRKRRNQPARSSKYSFLLR